MGEKQLSKYPAPVYFKRMWILFILIILIFTIVAISLLTYRYQSRFNLAFEYLENLALIHDDNLSLQMANIESITRSTVREAQNSLDENELQDYVVAVAGQLIQLRTLLVFSDDGTVIADSRDDTPAMGMNAGDRAYFIIHETMQNDTPVIGTPVQSRIDGLWSLPITTGVWNEDDEFMGVVAASIDPIFLSSSIENFTERGIIGYILNDDGVILTSQPYDRNQIGLNLSESDLARSIEMLDQFDNQIISDEPYLIIHRHVENYGLRVVFAQSRASIFQSFLYEVLFAVVVLTGLTLVTFLLFYLQIKQTRHIQQEALLRQQSQQELRAIIDNIPDYIFVKDTKGYFIETNRAHAEGAGLSRDEMLNKQAKDIYPPAFADQFHIDDEEVLLTGEPIFNQERRTSGVNGTKKWVLTTKIPLYDAESNIIGLVGISRDITDRRQLEKERLEAETLRMEIEQEREVIELKHRFITTASHDFRTPLAIIRSSTSLLQRYIGQLPAENQIAKYEKIQKQIDYMITLLDDVLTVSKVNTGHIEIKYTMFELESFCQQLWNDMLTLDEGKHPVDYQLSASIQQIRADEHFLQHTLVNVLSNAFKYTPPGKLVSFHISNDEHHVMFKIKDNGIGIPDQDMQHLFEPFHRAGNIGDIQGTGIGLAIAKEYIELHGGTIEVFSVENEGTSIEVMLPLNPDNE